MIKKVILNKYLICTLFCSTLYSETIELGNLVGITFSELNNKEIVTYNIKTNELNKTYYYVKDNQLYKKNDLTLYPGNDLNFNNYRLQTYKTSLKKIGCEKYKAKECILTFLPSDSYFEYDYKKVYILKDKTSEIYDVIKYNYNKFLE